MPAINTRTQQNSAVAVYLSDFVTTDNRVIQ